MHTELNLPNPKLLVKAVNTWVRSAFGNVFIIYWHIIDLYICNYGSSLVIPCYFKVLFFRDSLRLPGSCECNPFVWQDIHLFRSSILPFPLSVSILHKYVVVDDKVELFKGSQTGW